MSDQSSGGAPARPGAATAFGVLSIIFGALSLILQGIVGMVSAFAARVSRGAMGFMSDVQGAIASEDPEAAEAMGEAMGEAAKAARGALGGGAFIANLLFAILAIAIAALLLAAGISLLKGSKNTIKLNQMYAYAAIGLVVVRTIVNIVIGLHVGWFGAIIGLVYPILILVLVVKSQDIENWVASVNS